LTGTAEFSFVERPRFYVVLSVRHIDVDRLLHAPDVPRLLPSDAVKALAERFAVSYRPSIPVQIGIGVDALTMSGAIVQNLRGDIKLSPNALTLEDFELRAPGATQVQFGGRVGLTAAGLEFSGPVDVASTDSRSFMAWLDGRADASGPGRPLRARGDVTLANGKVAVDRINAEIDRKAMQGRLAYTWATNEQPARLEAAVNAAELDLDGLLFFARGALGGTTFDRPGEIALAFDVGRATVLGVEAKNAKGKLRFDSKGIQVEQLTIADLGGTALNASGLIDATPSSHRGSVTVDINARDLSGMSALTASFLPHLAPQIRRMAERLAPARLRATLDVAPAPGGNGRTLAKLSLGGDVGAMRVNLAATAAGETLNPSSFVLKLEGGIDADDGGDVLGFLGLSRKLAAQGRPQHFNFTAEGPLSGDLKIEGRLAGEVDASIRIASDDTPRIQEGHILLGHLWCQALEAALFGDLAADAT
jgi:large subunit ribosomal protein L24